MSLAHGSVLNISEVARECQVERKVVSGFLEILQDLLLAFSFPVFTRRARRALSTHPKLFLVDPGLFRALRPRGPLDSPEAKPVLLYRGSRRCLEGGALCLPCEDFLVSLRPDRPFRDIPAA